MNRGADQPNDKDTPGDVNTPKSQAYVKPPVKLTYARKGKKITQQQASSPPPSLANFGSMESLSNNNEDILPTQVSGKSDAESSDKNSRGRPSGCQGDVLKIQEDEDAPSADEKHKSWGRCPGDELMRQADKLNDEAAHGKLRRRQSKRQR